MFDVCVANYRQNQPSANADTWKVIETEFNATQLHEQETAFTLGNGYLGTRGTFEEGYPQNCPSTMICGIYDDVPFVNCPNWLPLVVTVAGDRFSLDSGEIVKYQRRLDLRLGLTSRDVRWRSPAGSTLDFHFERFSSLADQHISAIRCHITSIDFEGEITVEVGFDAQPDTQGVRHWRTLNQGGIEQIIWLQCRTIHSGIQLGMAAKLVVDGDETAPICVENTSESATLVTTFESFPGKTVAVEKIVTLFTSQDTEIPIAAALQMLADEPRYSSLLANHITAAMNSQQADKLVIPACELDSAERF
ncbi:MAG: glycoside hydrolase family 65 protein [Nodularia sp. (in: Bacteria)]|nr:MAG: glycoside hydrolase family 65 protein [Nodularia sp. (in: cyanobacteria)]